MRWLLAIALVLHLTGLPAVGGAVCGARAGGEHSCCTRDEPTTVPASMTAHCGCAMGSATEAAEVRAVGVAPDGRDLHTLSADVACGERGEPVPVRVALPEDLTPCVECAAVRLSGGGFRC